MLIVKIPDSFLPEREYAVNALFCEFLGLDIGIEKSTEKDYIILLENGKSLIVKDAFFSKHDEATGYLHANNVPASVVFSENSFAPEKDIPVIFGNEELEVTPEKIVCGIDVFASVFFMLTRWEESVLPDRDLHNRFPSSGSLARKFNFLQRPVVNEYVEFLWNVLSVLGLQKPRKKNVFHLVPTHDIDVIYYPCNLTYLLGDLYHLKNPMAPVKRIAHALMGRNFYDSFDWLMDVSEKNNCISRFYFMSNGTAKLDNKYLLDDNLFKTAVRKIKSRNHTVGFHPGYDTFNNPAEWRRQKKHLEEKANILIEEGRQHYLRLKTPDTWRIWEENSMKIDSTLCYADEPGFRCGTGNAFPVFDGVNRKKLKLKELPLIVMETPLHSNKDPKGSLAKSYEVFARFKHVCQKYEMPYTVLFHNSSFEPVRWHGWKELYEWVLK